MLVVPTNEPYSMLGNNILDFINCNLPSRNLKKKLNSIYYHRVCRLVSDGVINISHVCSKNNPTDVLTKSLGGNHHYEFCKTIILKTVIEVKDQGEVNYIEG